MNYVGHSDRYHDAGIAVVDKDGNIVFATHAERYDKEKNSPLINDQLWNQCVNEKEDHITYYQDPFLKYEMMLTRAKRKYKRKHHVAIWKDKHMPEQIPFDDYILHHTSHAAAGYYTRPWESSEDTVILTIDGMGEYQTSCIYNHKLELLDEHIIPKSIGNFYSKATEILGYKLLEEEYIVMGLSCYGEPTVLNEILDIWYANKNVFDGPEKFSAFRKLKEKCSDEDFAASIQKFAEIAIIERAKEARQYGSKLVYVGGVAQNIIANSMIKPLFDDMWIPPACGDSGSALGAAAYTYCKENNKDRINFTHPYLGYDINQDVNVEEVVDYILENKVCGIANGRAEWGPRALGNRSLLGDVRYDVKDTVNKIKKRELFRPFAPAILEEYADQYFEGPYNEYMQYSCKVKPITAEKYKSIVHVDGTARVQIVKKDCPSVLRQILEEYHKRTGVPMLLNTSLNIKGQPILNDEADCEEWEAKYNVKIFGWK